MNWEETILYIRTKPEFRELVVNAYFEEDLRSNIERFRNGEEYRETISIFNEYLPSAKTILDIGSGNGISAVSFALDGYKVTVSEPDPSKVIGAGAIRQLIHQYGLNNIEVLEEFAEKINFVDGALFDIVYVRQAMHHAYDLNNFIKNLTGLIKHGGLLVTVRDHVVYNEKDKEWFLESHPLHKYYGGENAFSAKEYEDAIKSAGLSILKKLKHFDSVINYFPLSSERFINQPLEREKEIEERLKSKIGILGKIGMFKKLYKKRVGFDRHKFYDEIRVPGRMYSYISVKK